MPSNYKTVINFRDGIQVDTDDLISNNGLVGIGSTIPRQQLDVRGNVIVEDNTFVNNLTVTGVQTNYGVLNVGTGYSVGIGTTVPEAAFQVGIGTTGFTVSESGAVVAQSFTGDGSGLTGLPAAQWINPGAGDTIYALKDVGIGTELTRGGADFGVGYEIYMDAESGIGTFEGIKAKNITAVNVSGQGQGTVVGDVGTFSTVTATTQIEAPQFIGTVTNATRSVVAAGLTDSPDIDVNYITGVGGTFTGITSFSTLQISGGVVASGGIITATTFAGTASTAVGAQTAYSLLGQPDILVDSVTVDGIAPSIIKGVGVSTIGQDLLVGEFLGVGATTSASGQAAGFIGTVRVSDGDIILGGSISIGGSIVGNLSLGGDTDVNTLNVGAGLSVAGITSFTGTVTGAGDMSFQGDISCDELNTTQGMTVGGAFTCGSVVSSGSGTFSGGGVVANGGLTGTGGGLVVGGGATLGGDISLTAGGAIGLSGVNLPGAAVTCGKIESAGGLVDASGGIQVAGGATIGGPLKGATDIAGTGTCTVSGGFYGAVVDATNGNFAGVVTTNSLSVGGDLEVNGIGTIVLGYTKLDGLTGLTTGNAYIGYAGVSTFVDINMTEGSTSKLRAKNICCGDGVSGYTTSLTTGLAVVSGGEIWVDTEGATGGIGIGSTSGQRTGTDALHVGLIRQGGTLVNTQSIFEGSVGIGTTSTLNAGNNGGTLEIYKNTVFWNNHTGVGGTIGVAGTTTLRIGINSGEPGGSLDMRYAGEAFILPRNYTPSGGVNDNPAYVDVNDADYEGSMWYDGHNKVFRVRMEGPGAVGLATDPGFDFFQERGWKGALINQQISGSFERYRDTGPGGGGVSPTNPPQFPVGWGTANQCYYQPTNQLQIYGSDSIWRSLVGSATTGVEFIIDGTTAKLNVAGVGSISLGTLS